jgi:chromosomal replication initiator protein
MMVHAGTSSGQLKLNGYAIKRLVAHAYNITPEELDSSSRRRLFARPRQVAMWAVRKWLNRTYQDIARQFKKDDHTTVIHAIKEVERLLETDPATKDKIADLELKFERLRLQDIFPLAP